MVFTAKELTPAGDVVNYISLAQFSKSAVLAGWWKFARYMHGATALRMVECDQLSRKQGRMVKVVTLVDLQGCTVSGLVWLLVSDIARFQEQVAADLFGTVFVLNASRLLALLFGMIVPVRLRQRVRVICGDGLLDADFVQSVGGVS